METAFYEDSAFTSKADMKKRLTLDLNSPRMKKPRFDVLLSSPDLNMLKMPSPELEKLILQQTGLPTPTPGQFLSSYTNPRSSIQSEQEIYTRGFADALAELHEPAAAPGFSAQPPYFPAALAASGPHQTAAPSSSTTFGLGQGLPQITVKEEPMGGHGSISSSPPMSPIDMESQEKIKLERKRQRNRIAASKCRRRKLERIAKLEDKVKILKGENTELSTVVHKLRQQICGLKEQVLEHVNSGCQIMLTSQF